MAANKQDEAIRAALLWDRPTLLRSTVLGAKAFAEAMGAPLGEEHTPTGDAPLSIAAQGVRFEQEGNSELAVAHYQRLAKADDTLVSLLGTSLLAWSATTSDPSVLAAAVATTRALPLEPDGFRARLLMKVATYALDKEAGELFKSLLTEASEAAPEGSALRWAIHIANVNLLRAKHEPNIRTQLNDPLVHYDWITDVALGAAREEIQAFLKTRIQSPWSWSIHFGQTAVDKIMSADRQATWAGALWLRDPIRQQLAAQILTDSSRDAYRTFYGVAMWLLSGGGNIAEIIDLAEPKFENDTAGRLIALLEGRAVLPRVRGVELPGAAAALWDLLPHDTYERLLDRLRPNLVPQHAEAEIKRFWAGASRVVPELWQQRFQTLEDSEQMVLLDALPVSALSRLPSDVIERLSAYVRTAGAHVSTDARATALLLDHLLGQDVTTSGLKDGAYVAAEIAIRNSVILRPDDYREAEAILRERLVADLGRAREGSFSFGGRSPIESLSVIGWATGAIAEGTVDTLVSIALDRHVSANVRFDVLMALTRLASKDLLSPAALQQLKTLPKGDSAGGFVLPPISSDLLHAGQLATRANQLDTDEEIAVLTLSRNQDPRVREIICGVAGRFLSNRSSAPVESALLAALFDPSEDVLEAALGALRTATLTAITEDAVLRRLVDLYDSYGRLVRAGAVTAVAVRFRAKGDPRARLIRERASRDRSWRVREAAMAAPDREPR